MERIVLLFTLVVVGTVTAAAVPPVVAGGAAECTFGILPAPLQMRPVLFDDFSYDNARVTYRGGQEPLLFDGSLFGRNTWHTCREVVRTRAWYRYSVDDLPLNDRAVVDISPGGDLVLHLRRGYRHDPSDYIQARFPQIVAGFAFRQGTFAARVRFSDLEPAKDINQAFFVISETANSELDFEWTNDRDFPQAGAGTMYNANHRNGRSVGARMRCRRRGGASKACEAYLREAWLTLLISYDGRAATYRIRYEGADGRVDWEQVLEDHLPHESMHPMFSNAVHIDEPRHLRRDHTMLVDWFYYSPDSALSFEAVHDDVRRLRTHGLTRVNTADPLAMR